MLYTKVNICLLCSWYNITHALNFHIVLCKCCSSMHTLGHTEQILEEYRGTQASSCEDTNIFPEQCKLRCIPPLFLDFAFNHYYVLSMLVH
jgi:hypothetical protein